MERDSNPRPPSDWLGALPTELAISPDPTFVRTRSRNTRHRSRSCEVRAPPAPVESAVENHFSSLRLARLRRFAGGLLLRRMKNKKAFRGVTPEGHAGTRPSWLRVSSPGCNPLVLLAIPRVRRFRRGRRRQRACRRPGRWIVVASNRSPSCFSVEEAGVCAPREMLSTAFHRATGVGPGTASPDSGKRPR
jgi:hypothetical protein